MPEVPLDRAAARRRLIALLALMVAGTPIMFLAADQQYGGDFLNIHAFHHCQYRDTPYIEAAIACDARGWPMNYPPLLYWSFSWVRWFSFETAYAIWAFVIAAGIVGSSLVWSAHTPGASRVPASSRWLFALALLFLFPSGFAIKTGNNDIGVLVLWSASLLAFINSWMLLAGVAAGLAAAYKLYPLVAIAVVVATLMLRHPRAVLGFGSGALGALLVVGAVLGSESLAYFSGNFARYITNLPDPSSYSHSIPSIANAFFPDGFAIVVSAIVLLAWVAPLIRNRQAPPSLLFAAALAVSTYFNTTSYDYNLLTTFPLLAYLFVNSMTSAGTRSNLLFICLVAGLLVLGNRNLTLVVERGREWYGVVQVAWLLGLAAVLYWTSRNKLQPEAV